MDALLAAIAWFGVDPNAAKHRIMDATGLSKDALHIDIDMALFLPARGLSPDAD